MAETDRELRMLQIRQLIDRGEYQIDPARIATSVIDEHLAASEASPDSLPEEPAEPRTSAKVAGG